MIIGWRYERRNGKRQRVNVAIEVELRLKDLSHFNTVEHEPAGQQLTLSITGEETEVTLDGRPSRRNDGGNLSGGQIDMHADGWPNGAPWGITQWARGWNRAKGVELLAIWRDWHMSDAMAGCAHMPVMRGDYDEHKDDRCPLTGYKFGSAWLVRPLPPEVVEWAEQLTTKEVAS